MRESREALLVRIKISHILAVSSLVGCALAYGCGSADEHPLGGPFGGDSTPPNPNKGTATAPTSTDPNNPNPNPTTTTTSTGNPPPPGHDAGSNPPPGHDAGGNPPPPTDAGGNPPPPVDANMPPPQGPTWTQIYAADFGPGSPGRCGDSGCHASTRSNFRCDSQSDCYSHFQSTGALGSGGWLTDPNNSYIWWFSNGGNMPTDNNQPSAQGLMDIQTWVANGAPNN
jgi:hypothetical protein